MLKKDKFVAISMAAVILIGAGSSLVSAAALTDGSLLLSDPRTGQTSSYTFSAAGYTATTLECIDVRLNDQADGTGSAPAGITTTSSTLSGSTLITAGSWTVNNGSNGRLRITNAGGEVPSASGTIVWAGITNGSSENVTYYAIATTYSDDTCTTPVDTTTVAYVYRNGELVQLTIDPTLTFTTNAVGSGQSVNGETTTVASTGTGINFLNDVTSVANGISAHDLTVGTNATGGYTVYIRHSGNLTNGSDVIDVHSGTNAAPTAFSAAGTEAWGYTTEDNALVVGAADRFTNPGNLWAGFSTNNEIVMDNPSAPSSTETVRVGQQVGVATTTPAGTYQTTIIYTAASTY